MTTDRTTQPALFDAVGTPAPPTPLDKRYAAMAAAHDKASDEWREAYEKFIIGYLGYTGDATPETIRLAYEASGNPQLENSKRASGGIFQRLLRRGIIVEVRRERSKLYGNFIPVYRLNI